MAIGGVFNIIEISLIAISKLSLTVSVMICSPADNF